MVSGTEHEEERSTKPSTRIPLQPKQAAALYYDNEAKIRQALILLMRIVNDSSIPRNIRRAATQAVRALSDRSLSPAVRAANAIGVLDEVSQDPNMPVHARTLLWSAITILETVKD
ncbi:MAG TPA: UPF0147 family protein [Ignisphaera sp.]|uniref:UPF0147 protein EYH02_05205 n=1 Tax=Ignisphaera aggregans TaxID=334771 RepID=A0A832YYV3_9CREN|nr:UPF0147 family protein [Ignisphaera sp.]HIP57446.1 UPF0147 family protein [Ignisphaera aggregans]